MIIKTIVAAKPLPALALALFTSAPNLSAPMAPTLLSSLSPDMPALTAPLVARSLDAAQIPDVPGRAVSAAAAVPAWFDARGLSFERVNRRETGFAYAVLSRGRYELGVFIDADGQSQATFTKF